MRTDSPAAVIQSLGLIEDDMARIELDWAGAAGREAEFADWHREVFLEMKETMRRENLLTKDALGITTKDVTETAIKDAVESALRSSKVFAERFEQHRHDARTLAMYERRFKSLDTRRSIGQTVLKVHLRDDDRYGQGARGQAGQGAD